MPGCLKITWTKGEEIPTLKKDYCAQEFSMEEKKILPRKALGRGLSILLGDKGDHGDEELLWVSPEKLYPNPDQPRKHFDEVALGELALSIKENGILQPILVREKSAQGYEIVAGERRWRAASVIKLDKVPCRVLSPAQKNILEIALLENIQREDLNPLEEALGYKSLMENFSYTQEVVARKVGKSRSYVTNILRLLQLPVALQYLLQEGKISSGHGKALLGADDPLAIAESIIKKSLNVRETERLVRQSNTRKAVVPLFHKKGGEEHRVTDEESVMAEHLETLIPAKARVENHAHGIRVELFFESPEHLERFIESLPLGGA